MKNHCWKNNFQNKNFNFLAKVVLDKIVLDYLLACERWFHYLVGCTETTLRDCTGVQSQLKMNAEEIKAYQRVRAPVLSSMWGGGVDFHRSFFTCTHPQVTGCCVHKLLGQAQVASAIIASRVSWSFSLGNYSFSTDSAILLRAEKRFSKLSQTSMVGYHHHWKNQEQVPITVLAGKGTGCTLRCCICTPTVKGMMAITHWQKRWRASELKADFTPKILNSYKLRREVPTYKQPSKTTVNYRFSLNSWSERNVSKTKKRNHSQLKDQENSPKGTMKQASSV